MLTYEGKLEIDVARGVLYFHDNATGRSVLRVCNLDKARIQHMGQDDMSSIDITLGRMTQYCCAPSTEERPIEHIHRHVRVGTFATYENVYSYLHSVLGRAPTDEEKMAAQRNQEFRINGEQHQFFRKQ